jgi:ferric-dicitrate binding protein FerR (iron transport regulator)
VTVGNATTVVRTVTGAFDSEIRQVKLLDDLYHNELLETAEGSATEVVFLDDTRLALGPNSSLVLDEFVYDPNPDKSKFVISATAGIFRFVSGNLPKKSYTIHTPTATIGIRGTSFTVIVLDRRSESGATELAVNITVEKGTAEVVSCHGERVLLDRPGLSTMVSLGSDTNCSPPTEPGPQPPDLATLAGHLN